MSLWYVLVVYFALEAPIIMAFAEETEGLLIQKRNTQYFGIPVPGQTVTALDIFTFLGQNCRPQSGPYREEKNIVGDAIKLLGNRGHSLAQQMYSNLFMAVAGVDMDKVMGKWYRVVDSRSVHPEKCVVTYYKPLFNSTYIFTFTSKDYFRKEDTVQTIIGHGSRVGFDPGQQLFNTGHPGDICPYTVVKTGPLDESGRYDYIILSQILKYPVMVLARNPQTFNLFYKEEVEKFLETYNFINPVSKSQSPIVFEDFTKCPMDYYDNIDDKQ